MLGLKPAGAGVFLAGLMLLGAPLGAETMTGSSSSSAHAARHKTHRKHPPVDANAASSQESAKPAASAEADSSAGFAPVPLPDSRNNPGTPNRGTGDHVPGTTGTSGM